mmetsp:Transcript_99308/g.155308  ORF Transcript_99308/g.155308 Transcript_99308/m.155308 type:complete len:156 (+) Transcript_99308:41-508(+)
MNIVFLFPLALTYRTGAGRRWQDLEDSLAASAETRNAVNGTAVFVGASAKTRNAFASVKSHAHEASENIQSAKGERLSSNQQKNITSIEDGTVSRAGSLAGNNSGDEEEVRAKIRPQNEADQTTYVELSAWIQSSTAWLLFSMCVLWFYICLCQK